MMFAGLFAMNVMAENVKFTISRYYTNKTSSIIDL